VNLWPFIGVDLNLWPTVYIAFIVHYGYQLIELTISINDLWISIIDLSISIIQFINIAIDKSFMDKTLLLIYNHTIDTFLRIKIVPCSEYSIIGIENRFVPGSKTWRLVCSLWIGIIKNEAVPLGILSIKDKKK